MTTKKKNKKLRVLHGKANHAIDEPCKFCDNVKKEYEADMTTKTKECKHKKGKIILLCDNCNQVFELPKIMLDLYNALVKEKEKRGL